MEFDWFPIDSKYNRKSPNKRDEIEGFAVMTQHRVTQLQLSWDLGKKNYLAINWQ